MLAIAGRKSRLTIARVFVCAVALVATLGGCRHDVPTSPMEQDLGKNDAPNDQSNTDGLRDDAVAPDMRPKDKSVADSPLTVSPCAPACAAGQVCVGGVCKCTPASCKGCCTAASKCLLAGQVDHLQCGKGGAACMACSAALKECQVPACSAGSCGFVNAKAETACTKGKCDSAGVCCTGCLDGTKRCQSGTTGARCGRSGNSCGLCSNSSECKTNSCATGECKLVQLAKPGSTCSAGKGRCASNGTCCSTCLNQPGNVCQYMISINNCGSQGSDCINCSSYKYCRAGQCSSN